ncbi:MAG: DNA gyrase inhibitor YacG [Succinivibrionaceae bacterium]
MTRIVKCPICGTNVEWVPENKFRPFCSKRCKEIDLSDWASGKNKISTPLTPEDLEDEEIVHQIERALVDMNQNNSQEK